MCSSLAKPMKILHASRSDVGMKRDNNEDNFLVFPEEHLFAVFDGMGATPPAKWPRPSPPTR